MSVRELEKQIRALPPRQLRHFSQWFDDYRQQSGPASEMEDDLTEAQKTELLRRIERAKAHPELLQPWKGTMAKLRDELYAHRAQTRRSHSSTVTTRFSMM